MIVLEKKIVSFALGLTIGMCIISLIWAYNVLKDLDDTYEGYYITNGVVTELEINGEDYEKVLKNLDLENCKLKIRIIKED